MKGVIVQFDFSWHARSEWAGPAWASKNFRTYKRGWDLMLYVSVLWFGVSMQAWGYR